MDLTCKCYDIVSRVRTGVYFPQLTMIVVSRFNGRINSNMCMRSYEGTNDPVLPKQVQKGNRVQ